MSVSFCVVKDRSDLDEKIREFLSNGGVIRTIETNEERSNKFKVIKRGLFFTVHHDYIAKQTGIKTKILKSIRNHPHMASKTQINTLYNFFKERDLSNIGNLEVENDYK